MTWLLERLAEFDGSPALIWRDEKTTYTELLRLVDTWMAGLAAAGVVRGSVVSLEGDYSPNSCALLLALIELGCVAVPLTSAARVHREEFRAIAEVEFTVSLDEEDRSSIEKFAVRATNQLIKRLRDQQRPGLVLFSSGSTGKSKGALHDFSALLEKFVVRRDRRCMLTFLLLDHIGGLNTLLYALSNGGTVVSIAARDPDAVCEAIERHHVQILPTSPTFLNLLLLAEAHRRHDLSSLEVITYGTEVMPDSTLQRVSKAFPDVRLQQTYGLSEVGILRSKSRAPDSLWVKVGGEGFETKVVDGQLWIRARSAMLGYLNAPSPFDAEGWLNTQDVVEVDGDYVKILGRRTEIINVGGQKVYPSEVESVLLEMENVRDATVYGEANALMGQIVAARLTLARPEEPVRLKQRVRSFCRDRLASYKIPARVQVAEIDLHSARYKKVRTVE